MGWPTSTPRVPSCSPPPPPPQPNLCCIATPPPQIPDPRILRADAPALRLDVRSSLKIAVCNSEVVRVTSGAFFTISGSPTGGSPGYQTTQASSGIGLNPLEQPPRNLPYLFNTDSGGFGASSQGGFGANGTPFVGGNGGNASGITDSTVSNPATTSANCAVCHNLRSRYCCRSGRICPRPSIPCSPRERSGRVTIARRVF